MPAIIVHGKTPMPNNLEFIRWKPTAGISAQTGSLPASVATGSLGYQLDEGFAFLDHAEIVARLFLEGVEAILQIQYLRLENAVALLEFM